MRYHLLLATIALSAFPLTPVNAQAADAGPDTSLCVNSYIMQGSPLPLGASGQWTIVAGCGTLTNPGIPVTSVNFLCIGTTVFQWTVDDGGNITADQMAITVFDVGAAVTDAGPDQNIPAPPGTAIMNANPYTWPELCQWSVIVGSFSIANPTDANTSLSGLLPGANILRWTCYNGPCGTTNDDVVLNCFVWTGLGSNASYMSTTLIFDPISRQLRALDGVFVNALEVMDVQGRSIIKIGGGTRAISLVDQPDGIYMVRAIMDDRPVVYRFVVGH